ncbi:FAD/NAD-P-binding domain-containing protein [Amylostereum chailletii]|nr:FAD/NAD-P-binding domain-containing protein [Amylostereum chailletii]
MPRISLDVAFSGAHAARLAPGKSERDQHAFSRNRITAKEKSPDHSIVIVGAGLSGIGMGAALRRRWDFDDFVIFDRGSDIGGTWRDNIYPGCASDVPIHAYSYSTDPKPDWNMSHGLQGEIHDYLSSIVTKYGLRSHCVLNTVVDSADWDTTHNLWIVQTRNTQSREITFTRAKIVIAAIGVLADPHIPKYLGSESFKGPTFHSARWRNDVDLHGKRVAIIGNGSSGVQVAPNVAKDPTTDVVHFCRTPVWFVDGTHVPYSPTWKWIYAHVPFALFLHRWKLHIMSDSQFVYYLGENPWLNRRMAKVMRTYITTNAPKEYHNKMIPTYREYPVGCKRLARDNGYLASLHRPNMHMNWDGIQYFTEDGIVTNAGDHLPFDAVIYATGFVTDRFPINVRGRLGSTLLEYYDQNGGPTAYMGSTAPGFPNFFTIMGPNLTTGHTSVVFAQEVQVLYALKLMKPIVDGTLTTFEPTSAATDEYNNWLQRRLVNSVYTQCHSWYRAGSDGSGKIFSKFPGPLTLFWWFVRSPRWQDYTVDGPGRASWQRKGKIIAVVRTAAVVTGIGAVGLGLLAPGKGWMSPADTVRFLLSSLRLG